MFSHTRLGLKSQTGKCLADRILNPSLEGKIMSADFRESRLQVFAARRSVARGAAVVWKTYTTPADGIIGPAQRLSARGTHAPARTESRDRLAVTILFPLF
jgi:hypothetical protein